MANKAAIRWYGSIDSTNSEARRRLGELDNLSVIAARFQTAGRGQGDHKWHSAASENLMFSVVLKFGQTGGLARLESSRTLLITEIVTVAIREFLRERHGITCRIKWPNDIYAGDRKLCGILIENVLAGKEVASSIIGVGLNVNQTEFPKDLPNPVSMSLLTGRRYDLEDTMSELAGYIASMSLKADTAAGREWLDEEFRRHVFTLPGDTRRP